MTGPLHSRSEAHLGYVKPFLKTNQTPISKRCWSLKKTTPPGYILALSAEARGPSHAFVALL